MATVILGGFILMFQYWQNAIKELEKGGDGFSKQEYPVALNSNNKKA